MITAKSSGTFFEHPVLPINFQVACDRGKTRFNGIASGGNARFAVENLHLTSARLSNRLRYRFFQPKNH